MEPTPVRATVLQSARELKHADPFGSRVIRTTKNSKNTTHCDNMLMEEKLKQAQKKKKKKKKGEERTKEKRKEKRAAVTTPRMNG